MLLDSARRVLVKLELKEAAETTKGWASQLVGRPVYVEGRAELLEDRLPPRESVVSEFVGGRYRIPCHPRDHHEPHDNVCSGRTAPQERGTRNRLRCTVIRAKA